MGMRKYFLPVFVAMLLLLGACGNDEEATNNETGEQNNGSGQVDSDNNANSSKDGNSSSENADSGETNSEQSDSEDPASNLATEDFFVKISEAMSSLNSYTLEFAIDINDTSGSSQLEHRIDYVLPDQMHMVQSFVTEGEETQTVEWYQTEDTIYMNMSGQWVKMPASNGDSVGQMVNAFHPKDYFGYVESIGENFSIKKDGDQYIAKYQGSPEVITKLNSDVNSSFAQDGAPPMEPTEVKEISYELRVDASNYWVEGTYYNVTMIMDGKEVKQEMNMVYSNFDSLDPIVVPEDVQNSAQSLY